MSWFIRYSLYALLTTILDLAIVLSLPPILNGKYPQIALLLVVAGTTTTIGVGSLIVYRTSQAEKARELFISAFPQHNHYTMSDFLPLTEKSVQRALPQVTHVLKDQNYTQLQLNPLEALKYEIKELG